MTRDEAIRALREHAGRRGLAPQSVDNFVAENEQGDGPGCWAEFDSADELRADFDAYIDIE